MTETAQLSSGLLPGSASPVGTPSESAAHAQSAEQVNHPAHYGGIDNPYEVIKVLEAWLTPDEFVGFLKGNIIKYNARARMKHGPQDHAKAAWYQNYLVDFEKRVS